MAKPPNSPKGFIMVMSVSAFFLQYYSMIYRTKNGMTEIMPFPENKCETDLLDRPVPVSIFYLSIFSAVWIWGSSSGSRRS